MAEKPKKTKRYRGSMVALEHAVKLAKKIVVDSRGRMRQKNT